MNDEELWQEDVNTRPKTEESAEIAKLTAEFKARGRKVTTVPRGVGAGHKPPKPLASVEQQRRAASNRRGKRKYK